MNSIYVIGETCTDKFIYGKSDRISPEAPVVVLKPIIEHSNKGMSGNVVENLNDMSNLNVIHIHQETEITKTRYVDKRSNHMFLRVDSGENVPCDPIKSSDIEQLDNTNIIISDYDKGFLSNLDIVSIAKSSKFTILDSKKVLDPFIVEHVDFIKLNEFEALNNQRLIETYPEKFLITLGMEGTMYNGRIYNSPNPQETIDVSGAGDTFVSAFTLKYLETLDIDESIVFANEMAAIVVGKKGVSTPTLQKTKKTKI